MSDRFSEEEERRRQEVAAGNGARALCDNKDVQYIFTALKDRYSEALDTVDIEEAEKIQALLITKRLVVKLQAELQQIAADGAVAEAILRDIETQRAAEAAE